MSASLSVGDRVGEYVLRARIGAGASAVVFDAVSAKGEAVALKVLREELASDRESVERMSRESQVLRSIEHEAIVSVIDAGSLSDGRPWIAMKRVEGESLRAAIERHAIAREPATVWALLRPLCLGLAAVHARGVIHRDVKPENILVTMDARSPRARLVDFGLSRAVDPSQTTLTGPGVALGTPPYMAPELWWNADVTAAVDQYAVACVAYELLTGAAPFAADSIGAWMEAHMHKGVAAIADPALSAERCAALDRFFARALAKDRADRFATMDELVREGDLAFGSVSTGRLISWAWVFPLLAPFGVAAAGHGGSHAMGELVRLAGHGVFVTLLAGLVALALTVRGRTPIWAGIAAALAGTFGASTGWAVVLNAVARAAPEARFSLLHQGLYEADVNRAVGYWIAWGASCAALAQGASRPWRSRSVAAWLAPFVLGGAAALLSALGATSAAQCLWMSTAAIALLSSRDDRTRDELSLGAALALSAVLAAFAASLVRHGAAEATVWNASLDRATRVARLTVLAREGSWLALAASLALAGVVSVAVSAGRSLRWKSSLTNAARALSALVAVVCGAAMFDAWQRGRVEVARASARAAIASQFALFSRLDLVEMPGLREPHVAPSVQLAQDVLAIDGVSVARSAALDTPAGRAAIAQDLSHRFARDRAGASDEAPRWTLVVDRRARWSRVRAVLALAREVGAGSCELLFGRGANPRWTVWAPPESALLLPADYGAIEVRIDDDPTALAFGDERAFASVADELVRASRAGVVRVRSED